MEDADWAELSAHYSRGEERGRLSAGQGLLEFTRTGQLAQDAVERIPELLGIGLRPRGLG
jgi:hypothetical protein